MILRWDLRQVCREESGWARPAEVDDTLSPTEGGADQKILGSCRVVEILGGDPNWSQTTVTTDSLCHYEALNRVLNTQMIIDWPITEGNGEKTYLTIGHPVLQRLIEGKTLGIAIKPLGALNASFYSMEVEGGRIARNCISTSRSEGDASTRGIDCPAVKGVRRDSGR